MKNQNYSAPFSRYLASHGLLQNKPLQVVDVGARGGPQSHWPLFSEHSKGKNIDIIGFEPDVEECERLNKDFSGEKKGVPFRCYPVALGSKKALEKLYTIENNHAANTLRMHPEASEDTLVSVERFEDFAKKNNIKYADFFKIDVEGSEIEVLKGLGDFLDEGKILGFELELFFNQYNRRTSFSEAEILLRNYGYYLGDMDLYHSYNPILPMPVAWDHRDHNNNPILGPTISGSIEACDAVFFKDLSLEEQDIRAIHDWERVLKMAALYEIYGLGAESFALLHKYKTLLDPILPFSDIIGFFIPDYYGKGLTHQEYLDAYHKHVGRIPSEVSMPLKSKGFLENLQSFFKKLWTKIKRKGI